MDKHVEDNEVWVVAAKRTPMGKFQGELASFSATDLGGIAISAALKESGLDIDVVDEVVMGCVLTAGVGQAPARQAALNANLNLNTPCTTVNKVCGSGMKAVMMATTQIRIGEAACSVAGGMESMTNAPYLLPQGRNGMRIGHKTTYDHMFLDGLQDAYEGELMGVYGQRTADALGYSREQMDEWAVRSAMRAKSAIENASFSQETAKIQLDNNSYISNDELPSSIRVSKIPSLKPAFDSSGTITAANSSAISDGAAALVLISKAKGLDLGLAPLAVVKGQVTAARRPSEFTLAPLNAIQKLLKQVQWNRNDVDLWEINEAFAVVTQIAIDQLELDSEKVNVKGGACALGHPIGASGARILVTLIHALRERALKSDKPLKGIATLCIGGGEATAVAIEVPNS